MMTRGQLEGSRRRDSDAAATPCSQGAHNEQKAATANRISKQQAATSWRASQCIHS